MESRLNQEAPFDADGRIFHGNNNPHDTIDKLPDPPPWRKFTEQARRDRGRLYQSSEKEIELVNAALYLRRPLLVTGKPGTGKSSLAYAVAHELKLENVLVWPITTRTTLNDGLYHYDAIARLQDASLQRAELGDKSKVELPDIGRYIRLGPLGTALLPSLRPRVLLIDEIDKSDVDLPNDLLHVFEEGEFEIQELSRLPKGSKVKVRPSDSEQHMEIEGGKVRCDAFPFVIMTSNGEREFPPAFLRRCLRLNIEPPGPTKLERIVKERLAPGSAHDRDVKQLIDTFVGLRDEKQIELATDQLLNAVYLTMNNVHTLDREHLRTAILRSLTKIAL